MSSAVGRVACSYCAASPGRQDGAARHAADATSGFRIVRAFGVEAEMELPFAALQTVCAPMLDRLDRLPEPQQAAIGTAFG